MPTATTSCTGSAPPRLQRDRLLRPRHVAAWRGRRDCRRCSGGGCKGAEVGGEGTVLPIIFRGPSCGSGRAQGLAPRRLRLIERRARLTTQAWGREKGIAGVPSPLGLYTENAHVI